MTVNNSYNIWLQPTVAETLTVTVKVTESLKVETKETESLTEKGTIDDSCNQQFQPIDTTDSNRNFNSNSKSNSKSNTNFNTNRTK